MPTQRTNRQGKKLWYGRITLSNGKRKEKAFASKKEALAWETLVRQKLTELSAISTQKAYSLHSLLTLNIQSCRARGLDQKSINEKKLVAKLLLEKIEPETPVETIGYQRIEDFLNHIASTRSGYRANRFRGHLLQAYNWGIKALNLPTPCPWQVERYKTQKSARYVPPLEDFTRVAEIADGDKKALLLTYFYTAARKQEVLNLKWEDVDFHNKTLRLWTSKRTGGKEYNIIPMSQELHNILSEQLQRTAMYPHVFINNETGGCYVSLTKLMPSLCRAAGVKPFGFHAIRHLAASLMSHGGLALSDIQGILRHQKADTTSRYLHSMQGNKDVGRQLDNVLILPIKQNPLTAPTAGSFKKGESQGESLIWSAN